MSGSSIFFQCISFVRVFVAVNFSWHGITGADPGFSIGRVTITLVTNIRSYENKII